MWGYVAIVALLYAIYRYRLMFKGFENVKKMYPGVPCQPFIGNLLEVYGDTCQLFSAGERLCTLFRRSFYLWIGPFLFISVIRPHEAEAVLNNTVHIKKARIYDSLLPWIKRGLLTSYGNKWKKSRKLLTPAFHFGVLDAFLETFNRNGTTFCRLMEKKLATTKFNVMEMVKMYALDNICEAAMGIEIHAQENPTSEYIQALKRVLIIFVERILKFWLRFDWIFNLSPTGKEHNRCLNILHGYTRNVIEQRVQQRREGGLPQKSSSKDDMGITEKKVFLDILLDNYDSGIITLEEVQEEVDTFLFEGHDTITSALSFTLYSLGMHQEFQNRAYQEQFELFGDDDRDPTTDDIVKMKYLEMVIKEVLRLYPSVPVYGRYIETDCHLDEFTTVPAGAEAMIVVAGLHRDPGIWPEPYKFDPERFTLENIANRHPYAYLPFSAGPRNCIGMRFAMIEMKSFLSKVLRKYQINPCQPPCELQLALEVTLQSATGVPISVALRKK